MIFATEQVQRYRQSLHYLWNYQFWGPDHFRDHSALGQFQRVKLPLFLSLVLDRLGSDLDYPDTVFGEAFKLIPRLQSIHGISTIRIEQPANVFGVRNGPFFKKDLVLSIIDLYDWQELDFRDFRYFLTRIEKFEAEPALVGSRVLVEVGEVDVIWHPPGIIDLPKQPGERLKQS